MNWRAEYARFLAKANLPSTTRRESGSSADRRRRWRERQRQQLQNVQEFEVKLTAKEKARSDQRREYIDSAVCYLSNYSWSYFITLTFGQPQGPESIDRAIKRFTRFVHVNVFGEFDEVRDVRDLYGIRYVPAQERGRHGEKRLHAHLIMCGGEVLGERLDNAKWLPWQKWWNKHYGGLKVEKPESQADVVAYCTKYMLKGEETGFELCSTWADERDRRKRAEAPLLEERKVGIDVTRSAEMERSAFRCESPRGTGRIAKSGGKPCRRCGLVSLCRCWSGTSESGQIYGPEPDAGACEGASEATSVRVEQSAGSLALSSQMELRMHQQLALSESRRERRRVRYRQYTSRSSYYAVVLSSAAFVNHVRALA